MLKIKIDNPTIQEQVLENVKNWRNQTFKDLRKQINDEINALKEGRKHSDWMLDALDVNRMYWECKESEKEEIIEAEYDLHLSLNKHQEKSISDEYEEEFLYDDEDIKEN
ncbi:MAG: hypothetical protein LBC44_03725 [Mycoplasmataceae bacterium]|nr:hypothetical protein [Mycoplasmataceae bacterium]